MNPAEINPNNPAAGGSSLTNNLGGANTNSIGNNPNQFGAATNGVGRNNQFGPNNNNSLNPTGRTNGNGGMQTQPQTPATTPP